MTDAELAHSIHLAVDVLNGAIALALAEGLAVNIEKTWGDATSSIWRQLLPPTGVTASVSRHTQFTPERDGCGMLVPPEPNE